jgi:hypothetical protein
VGWAAIPVFATGVVTCTDSSASRSAETECKTIHGNDLHPLDAARFVSKSLRAI